MIEIGEKSKIRMTYEEAVMYCFALGSGWRLPSEEEYDNDNGELFPDSWYFDDIWRYGKNCYYTVPVRELKDD